MIKNIIEIVLTLFIGILIYLFYETMIMKNNNNNDSDQ